MSTDSFVVSPQFFPGGNIGRLAVCGTVNDVATSGANVRYLSCGFILEEGYPMDKLHQIVQTMAETAREAGVSIITGDTKVVERGGADGVYINTAGVGIVPAGATSPARIACRETSFSSRAPWRPWHCRHESTRGPHILHAHRERCRATQPPHRRRACSGTSHPVFPRSHPRRSCEHTQRVRAGK